MPNCILRLTVLAVLSIATCTKLTATPRHVSPEVCKDVGKIVRAAIILDKSLTIALSPTAPDFRIRLPLVKDGRVTHEEVTASSKFWTTAWDGIPPPTSLVNLWYSAPTSSASLCSSDDPDIGRLARLGFLDSGYATSASSVSTISSIAMYRISFPVFDSRAGLAMSLVTHRSGSINTTTMVLFKRYGAQWAIAGSRVVEVS